MEFLDNNGLKTLWNKIKNYIDNLFANYSPTQQLTTEEVEEIIYNYLLQRGVTLGSEPSDTDSPVTITRELTATSTITAQEGVYHGE